MPCGGLCLCLAVGLVLGVLRDPFRRPRRRAALGAVGALATWPDKPRCAHPQPDLRNGGEEGACPSRPGPSKPGPGEPGPDSAPLGPESASTLSRPRVTRIGSAWSKSGGPPAGLFAYRPGPTPSLRRARLDPLGRCNRHCDESRSAPPVVVNGAESGCPSPDEHPRRTRWRISVPGPSSD